MICRELLRIAGGLHRMIRLVHRGTVTLFREAWYLLGIHPGAGPQHEMLSSLEGVNTSEGGARRPDQVRVAPHIPNHSKRKQASVVRAC